MTHRSITTLPYARIDCENRTAICGAFCCEGCEHLSSELRCTVYAQRPDVCRDYTCYERWEDYEGYKMRVPCRCAERLKRLLRWLNWSWVDVTVPQGRRKGWCPNGEHVKRTRYYLSLDDVEDHHFRSLLRLCWFEVTRRLEWKA